MSWSAASKCVTLSHAASGAAISLSPTGHVAYTPSSQQLDALGPFLDGCADLCHQQQQQVVMKETLEAEQLQHDVDQQDDNASDGGLSESEGQEHQCARQTLGDVCGQPECWGVLGVDLLTGQAALHEEPGVCRLSLAPGEEGVDVLLALLF